MILCPTHSILPSRTFERTLREFSATQMESGIYTGYNGSKLTKDPNYRIGNNQKLLKHPLNEVYKHFWSTFEYIIIQSVTEKFLWLKFFFLFEKISSHWHILSTTYLFN